jgi:hypothetical protein
MPQQPSDLVPPTEQERARTAVVLGAILGLTLVLFARRR